jgi:hypothetical protein
MKKKIKNNRYYNCNNVSLSLMSHETINQLNNESIRINSLPRIDKRHMLWVVYQLGFSENFI